MDPSSSLTAIQAKITALADAVTTMAGASQPVQTAVINAVTIAQNAATLAINTLKSQQKKTSPTTPTNPGTVTVSPKGATVAPLGTLLISATVKGTSGPQTAAWDVDGVRMGNTTVGTLTQTSDVIHMSYKAPATGGTHTVRCVVTSNTTGGACSGSTSLTVTSPVVVTPPPSGGGGGTTTGPLSLSPGVPTAVGSGGTIAFVASMGGNPTSAVTWAVDGVTGGNATVGTISPSGLYTAPTSSSKAIRTITATSTGTPTVTASVRILTVASNATVNAKTGYGATGNGTTDDSAAIGRALAATGNGICFVPDGTYLINPIAVESKFGIVVPSGATLLLSPGATLKCKTMTTSGGYSVVGLEEADTAMVGGTVVGDRVARNLPTYINGSGSDMEAGQGVSVKNASGLWLLGVTAKNCCCDGIYIYNNASNVKIYDCVSDNNRRQGCSLVYCHDIEIKHSTFSNTNGNDPATGIDFEPNSGSTVANVLVEDCDLFGNVGGGIAGGGSTKNGPTGNGTAFCTDCEIKGCRISGNGGSNYKLGGIAWDESDRIKFTDNVIKNNNGDGIWIAYHARDFVISGNTVTGNQGDGIYMEDAAGTTVSGNTVNSNSGTEIRNADNSATVGSNTVS